MSDSPMTRSRARRSGSISAASTPLTASTSASVTASMNSSSTSLSSMGDETKGKPLLDTYGNEFQIPDFTIKDIRDAIPKHCFKRSAIRSLSYVARDLALLAGTFWGMQNYVVPAIAGQSTLVRGAAWAVYGFTQGLFGTGIWVLAHECGHQAFSESKILNDTVGWILHSSLLVPYFSWKISHGKHHHSTGNLEKDMVFVPKTRTEYLRRYAGGIAHDVAELTEETPIATLTHSIAQQLVGWILYLFTNVTGHNYHHRQKEGRGVGKKNGYFGGVSHFNPSSPLYEAKDAKLIVLSDIGIALMGYALYAASQKFGAFNVFLWYGIPYLWVNHWLVAITFLQHTDPSLPHYNPETWNYCRGAAATIDREFGFIGRHLMHGIVETHVLHHFIPLIPFYHADEASEAIKKVMGRHYRSDTRGGAIGFIKALWTSARWCQWVEPSDGAEGEGKGVLFFRNRNGLGVKPLPKEKFVHREKEIENMIAVGVLKKEDVEKAGIKME
ncbi:fatty acid desaturase-domain-containing protein [Pyronema domesticum]|uniref:Similar to Delta(12) fatty acid desaturase acc. no. P59668 n=1 Tax=Pyronema omphalodes (strain CBS 100304) TaxID=1076935 RepID=U4L064_PYROM|nr:fatty acid desaturase-domain-containing protein [Pyronema domesticum]CCX05374.1 Similar to Delta(12) fatty acid desaturase; acc. no. P59668 [Pyronema omphalodes CBS 100304]